MQVRHIKQFLEYNFIQLIKCEENEANKPLSLIHFHIVNEM